MKNNKIILAVLILFMIVMIALIFSGCGGGNLVTPSPEPEPDLIPEIELEEEKSEEIIFDEDFSVTLEDGVEIEIKANTINKNALLYVSKIAINKNKSSSNVALLSLYDIDIFGDFITLSGTVALKLPVPAGMTEDEVIIGHFHQGSTDILMGNLISGKYVVEVSEFSEFGVFSKNSADVEVSSDDLNEAASGYVTSQSSISWAPPEKPEFKTKSNTWFDSDEKYEIEWTDSFWTPMIKYEIEEYLYAFDENKKPYTTHVTVSDHYTYDNNLAIDEVSFFYRIRAHNTWTNKYSEWTEPIKIILDNFPPPNLTISTHEVTAGEKYSLSWNVTVYTADYEIKEVSKLDNGDTSTDYIEVDSKGEVMLDNYDNTVGGTIIYAIQFYTDGMTLPLKKDVPGTYYYSIRAVNGSESPWNVDSPESGDAYVEVIGDGSSDNLDAPTGVDATDGGLTGQVYITWNSVSGASHYKVYRAASETGTKTAITSWKSGFYYPDYDVTPGTHYFYFVKAASSNTGADESPYSDYDEGWAYLDTTLSAPTGVSASNGTYTDKVYISWNTVSGASYYKLYRAASETGTKTAITNWVTSHTYYDYDVTPGTHYFYFAKAASSNSGADESPYSDNDEGWAYLDTTLSAPTGVTASWGTYTDKIKITWNSVSGASHYQVYRAVFGGTKTDISSWQTSTTYYDYDVFPGRTYYYWVKAATSSSGANASDYNGGDTIGWAELSAPTGVSASDGTYTDKVKITWNSVTAASAYKVYRANSVTGTKTEISSWQSNLYYYDYDVTPGTHYFYFVKAENAYNQSPYSDNNEGWAKEETTNYNISISVANPAYGTTSPPPGTYSAEEGSTYVIIALPGSGHTFDYWSGDNDGSPTSTMAYVLMDSNKSITAHFK